MGKVCVADSLVLYQLSHRKLGQSDSWGLVWLLVEMGIDMGVQEQGVKESHLIDQ